MSIQNINKEYLKEISSLKEKSNLKVRLENNLRIQKMLYNYEKTKIAEDKENSFFIHKQNNKYKIEFF